MKFLWVVPGEGLEGFGFERGHQGPFVEGVVDFVGGLCYTMDDVKAATGKEMDLNSPEVPKGAEPEFSGELVCLLLGLGAMVIYKLIGEVGVAVIRRIVAGEETQPELKVKLLDKMPVEPSRGSDEAAGYDLATCNLARADWSPQALLCRFPRGPMAGLLRGVLWHVEGLTSAVES